MIGSTDVGDVSWVVPTVQARGATYAIGTPGHSWQITAQGKSGRRKKGMVHAAKVMAGIAVDALGDPALIARAKADLKARTEVMPYDCPLPADVKPPIRGPGPRRRAHEIDARAVLRTAIGPGRRAESFPPNPPGRTRRQPHQATMLRAFAMLERNSMGEFAIGQSVSRFEDPKLLQGEGRYIDDVVLPSTAFGVVVRSPHAHARIKRIDTAAAKAAEGVLVVLTGTDWKASGSEICPFRKTTSCAMGLPCIARRTPHWLRNACAGWVTMWPSS